MRSMCENLVEEPICDVTTTGYCTATDTIKNSPFLIEEGDITEIIHLRVLDKKLNQSFNCWSPSDTIMQALVKMIFNYPGFIVPFAVFVEQCVINTLEKRSIESHL